MGKVGFLFSGQGAQYVGMAKEWYENDLDVKELFDKANKRKNGILDIMFNGTSEELKITSNTQPALYLANIASAICANKMGLEPMCVAGFSLGELSALSYAGVYSYLEGFDISCRRGEFMQEVSFKYDTSMAAVLKLSDEKVEQLCLKYNNVYPVNYNCEGQIVVSGLKEEIKKFSLDVKSEGGRAIPLKVSGAFHSPYMDEAAVKFSEELKKYEFYKPAITCYSNRSAGIYDDICDIKRLLTEQINHPVRWTTIIKSMASSGVDTFIETGVGNVLTGLIKKIVPECKSYACSTPEELKKIMLELK